MMSYESDRHRRSTAQSHRDPAPRPAQRPQVSQRDLVRASLVARPSAGKPGSKR